MFGDIAARLRSRAPETEFEHGLRRFSLLILRTTIVLVLFILMVSIVLKHDAFESLLFAVALESASRRNSFPMISSVTLTQGALRMARAQVIVKHLPAIQNFGSIDILCSDKTGTLTAGTMQFDRALDPRGAASPRPLTLAYINSRFETGIRSPLDAAILLQPSSRRHGLSEARRDPVRFRAAPSLGGGGGAGWRGPSSAHHQGGAGTDPRPVHGIRSRRPDRAARPGHEARCAAAHDRVSADGLRVLAVAYRWLEPRDAYSRADEADLVLAGFISFADPILADVGEVLADLKRDGVTVKILTGDNELVAHHVCQRIGLEDQRIVTGADIARIDDAALGQLAEQASVFTRVSPAQKDRIITKRRGHVVGYMGTGLTTRRPCIRRMSGFP